MGKYSEAYVGLDTSKTKHAVAVAEGGRNGEVRFWGEVTSSAAPVERLIGKLAERYDELHFATRRGQRVMGCTGKSES